MKAMIARGIAPLMAALLLSACAAPSFRQPEVAVPVAFREAPPAVQTAADGSRWHVARPA